MVTLVCYSVNCVVEQILVTFYSHAVLFFFFSSRRRHTRFKCDWSSDVCSSDLSENPPLSLLFEGSWVRCATCKSVHRPVRSEERRVGKECRSRWSPYH